MEAKLEVRCPHCGKVSYVSESCSGVQIECARCGSTYLPNFSTTTVQANESRNPRAQQILEARAKDEQWVESFKNGLVAPLKFLARWAKDWRAARAERRRISPQVNHSQDNDGGDVAQNKPIGAPSANRPADPAALKYCPACGQEWPSRSSRCAKCNWDALQAKHIAPPRQAQPFTQPAKPHSPPSAMPGNQASYQAWRPHRRHFSERRNGHSSSWLRPIILLLILGGFGYGGYYLYPKAQEMVIAQAHRPHFSAREAIIIQACLEYVDAQNAYRRTDWDSDGVLEYSTSILGDKSLYEFQAGKGDLTLVEKEFAQAESGSRASKPMSGYWFKILKGQGPQAKGGEKSYVTKGGMTEGYGLVGWPAEYGKTGVNTFIVSQDGVVYKKDLGEVTPDICRNLDEYNPDEGWLRADLAETLAAAEKEVEPAVGEAVQTVEDWLSAQQKGESGLEYWDDPKEAQSMYSVQKWERLKDQMGLDNDEAIIKVRIWSSTKGGLPMVKDWKIMVTRKDGNWRISSIEQ